MTVGGGGIGDGFAEGGGVTGVTAAALGPGEVPVGAPFAKSAPFGGLTGEFGLKNETMSFAPGAGGAAAGGRGARTVGGFAAAGDAAAAAAAAVDRRPEWERRATSPSSPAGRAVRFRAARGGGILRAGSQTRGVRAQGRFRPSARASVQRRSAARSRDRLAGSPGHRRGGQGGARRRRPRASATASRLLTRASAGWTSATATGVRWDTSSPRTRRSTGTPPRWRPAT